PLTPSPRSGNLIAGDGTKNGFPLRTKNRQKPKPKSLTGNAPYTSENNQFRCGEAAVITGRTQHPPTHTRPPPTLPLPNHPKRPVPDGSGEARRRRGLTA